MKVFEFKEFPNPACVGIALAEKQMTDQVDFISINIPAGEHNEPAFLEKSSNGTVPVLELDEGTIISECTAITEYIDSLSGERVLSGQSPKERVVIHMMQRRAEANSLDAISTYFHHATPGFGD